MSGCLPIWTSDNSGIFPLWIGDDVGPVFADAGLPCIDFAMTDMNLSFTSKANLVSFTSKALNITFSQTCR